MRVILDKFPSIAHVARGVGANYKAATKWRERDSIPAHYDTLLVELAQSEGIDLSLEEIAAERAALKNHGQTPSQVASSEEADSAR